MKIDGIKRDPYLSCEYEYLHKKFGNEKLARFLTVRIARAIRRLKAECIDNHRVADVADSLQMEKYRAAVNGGC